MLFFVSLTWKKPMTMWTGLFFSQCLLKWVLGSGGLDGFLGAFLRQAFL